MALRVNMSQAGIRELMRDTSIVEGRTAAIRDACNAESSWGGYQSEVTVSAVRARGRIWSISEHDGTETERAHRMIRHLSGA